MGGVPVGSVVLSIDAELGWGFPDTPIPMERVNAARSGWRELLGLLDAYDVPATWAVVGHLFLDDCDGTHRSHPAGPDHFSIERTSLADRPDLRYCPDLIDLVRDADVDHELASHTFSHVMFGAEETTTEMARTELEWAIEAAADHDSMRSFVFPRNSVGHRDVLAEWGFDAYRGTSPYELTTARKLLTATIGSPRPKLVTPTIDEYGLVDVPASLYLFGFEGAARRLVGTVRTDPIVRHAMAGVDAAARAEEGVFHMWLHPNNIVDDAAVDRLRSILQYVDLRRDELALETMGQVAGRVAPERSLRADATTGERSIE
jgi:peptidoglycan/xylan/chitin deacetylase (PgdA/CDA1 family)